VEKKREGKIITTKPYFEKMRDLGKQLRRPCEPEYDGALHSSPIFTGPLIVIKMIAAVAYIFKVYGLPFTSLFIFNANISLPHE